MKRTFLFCIAILSVLPSLDVYAQKPSLDSLFKFANEKTVAGDVPGATALLLAANKLAQADNNVPMLCRIQVTMGKVSMISENKEGVEAAVQQGLRFCSACKDTNNLAKIYLLKGVLKIKQQQNDSAIVFFKLSANLYLTKKDTMGSTNALAKIGNVLEVEKKYAEALPYYLKLDLLWCCKSISYALNRNSRGQHRHPECRRKGRNHVHGGVPIRFDTFSSLRYCVLP